MSESDFKFRVQEIIDPVVHKMQKDLQDKFARKTNLDEKAEKITTTRTNIPKIEDMVDGQEILYFDGTNYYMYKRIKTTTGLSKLIRFAAGAEV